MSAQEKISRIVLAEDEAKGACIKVVGVGGGGGNAITRMMEAGLHGVEFIAVNTDLQALKSNRAPVKIQIGGKLTKGLGAGADPDVGRQAAVDDTEKLADALEGADMVFIAAGLGGGKTRAAPLRDSRRATALHRAAMASWQGPSEPRMDSRLPARPTAELRGFQHSQRTG